MNINKEKWLTAVWYLLIFSFLFVWFSRIHPVVVYDADDWLYTAYVRPYYPTVQEWNPARIFPEVWMPFCSAVAIHVLLPVIGDFVTALTVMHALVISLFILGYLYAFVKLVKTIYKMDQARALLLCTLFLILHFLVLRCNSVNNLYMFHCVDVTCYYYYLMPSLLNAAIVMHMMVKRFMNQPVFRASYLSLGMYILVLYLAIFSNLPSSGILAAYAGSILLLELIRMFREKEKIADFVKNNGIYIGILLAWLVSAVFELCGERAAYSASETSFFGRIIDALYCLKEILIGCNAAFWLAAIVFTVGAAVLLLISRGKKQEDRDFLSATIVYLIAAVAIGVYTAILCAAVSVEYAYRVEYLYGIFFYGLLLLMLAAGYIFVRIPKIVIIVPLAVFLLVGQCNTYGEKTFQESNVSNADPEICGEITRDILNQFIVADRSGQKQMVLYVPKNTPNPQQEDNWPHSAFLMERLPSLLYELGITSKRVALAEVVITEEMNMQYGLPVPKAE